MPTTLLGRWSTIFILLVPILFFLGTTLANSRYAGVDAGSTIIEDFSARPLLAGVMLLGMVSGVAAFATGLFARIRLHDRSFAVTVATLFGGMVCLFLIGEIVFPH